MTRKLPCLFISILIFSLAFDSRLRSQIDLHQCSVPSAWSYFSPGWAARFHPPVPVGCFNIQSQGLNVLCGRKDARGSLRRGDRYRQRMGRTKTLVLICGVEVTVGWETQNSGPGRLKSLVCVFWGGGVYHYDRGQVSMVSGKINVDALFRCQKWINK